MTDNEFHEDASLGPEEKQFSIVGTKAEDRLVVHSEIRSVTRRLYNHGEATVRNVRRDEEGITAITVSIPISCLSIKATPRVSGRWGQVVSDGVFDVDS
jgi:hypothetical protein